MTTLNKIEISTKEEYQHLISRGYEPLTGYCAPLRAYFDIDNVLRRELQKERFKTKESFYKFCYAISNKICEECGLELNYYSAINVSHILTRQAHPVIALDPRNFNLLTFNNHRRWETGDRKNMKIYNKNQETMQMLQLEYYGK